MDFKKILLTTDLSTLSLEAFRIIAPDAQAGAAEVTLFTVVSDWIVPPSMFEEIPLPERIDEYRKNVLDSAHRKIAELANRHFPQRTVKTEIVLSVRSEAEEICEYARAHGSDLIVMASHGRGAVASIFIGSTTQRVLSLATCPVLVVPVGKRQAPGLATKL